MNPDSPPIVMTIAGSDPSGGAGIQADLRTFDALGLYGLSVVTAVTAQNTREVRQIFPMAREQVQAQMEVILADAQPAVTKTGMLTTADAVKEVALAANSGRLGRLVVDPVLSSTSGQSLGERDLAKEIIKNIIPVCDLVMPNIPEATLLTGVEIVTMEDSKEAALAMTEIGARAICVTGGHLRGDPVDVLFDGKDFTEFPGQRLGGKQAQFHGTGCLFSAATAGYLALGLNMVDSVRSAKKLVETAIRGALSPGAGAAVPWLKLQVA